MRLRLEILLLQFGMTVHPWIDRIEPNGLRHYQLMENKGEKVTEYRISEYSCAGQMITVFFMKDGQILRGSYINQLFDRGPICLPEPKELRAETPESKP